MGFLSWLFGRRNPAAQITVWLDEPSRSRALVREVRDDLQAGRSVVVVAHFAEALIEAGRQLASAGIKFSTLTTWQPLGSTPSVVAILAKALPRPVSGLPPREKVGTETRVVVRGVELHVLARENDRLVQFAASLPGRAEIAVATSMDAPVFTSLQRPWAKSLVTKLGMSADQPVDSPLLTRGLTKALLAIEKRARRDRPAESVAQWIERNVDPQ
jgi:hypothetical protein